MHYRQIQWDQFSPDRLDLPHLCFIQSLRTLDLGRNLIGDKGAQYLGNALRINSVRQSLLLSVAYSSSLSRTDAFSTESLLDRYRWRRSAILSWCIATEFGETNLPIINSMFTAFIPFRHSQCSIFTEPSSITNGHKICWIRHQIFGREFDFKLKGMVSLSLKNNYVFLTRLWFTWHVLKLA